MKLNKLLLSAILTIASVPAIAGMRAPVDAYEASLQYLRLPQSSAGTVTIESSGCDTCSTRQFRVTAATNYVANGRSYLLAEYRKLLATVRDREGTYLTIVHDRESDAVIEIRVGL